MHLKRVVNVSRTEGLNIKRPLELKVRKDAFGYIIIRCTARIA